MKILIVDDESSLVHALSHILEAQGYQTVQAADGIAALAKAVDPSLSLILLDVMLPGKDGFTVCRELRAAGIKTPILMLTAKDAVYDKVNGLDCGADDYMTKPFASEELLARIRALVRRQGTQNPEELCFGDLKLGLFSRVLTCEDRSVRLGFKELDVLRLLMLADGKVISKDELMDRVWGQDTTADPNSAEAYISFLRKKLQQVNSRTSIATIRRAGYYLTFR